MLLKIIAFACGLSIYLSKSAQSYCLLSLVHRAVFKVYSGTKEICFTLYWGGNTRKRRRSGIKNCFKDVITLSPVQTCIRQCGTIIVGAKQNPFKTTPHPANAGKNNEHANSQNETKISKTYNSTDSLMVTHLTTSVPVHCLSKAERTGSPVFSVLWSYVLEYSSL
ncbi:hypothetical protein IQ07DRAFT_260583 [Pyrenochaeta sp. DS3sAY3a]|nr:hypothetical protein IQ07DRAFT_260583 [Pyrenochaeta sp. DS3sAY3a]